MGVAEEFAERLIEAKDRAGMGISAFEEHLGLKRSTINSIVSGKNRRVPSIAKAEAIAKALGWEVYIGPVRKNSGFERPLVEFDVNVLAKAVYLVDEVQDELEIDVSNRGRAAVIAETYDQIRRQGDCSPDNVRQFFRLVS